VVVLVPKVILPLEAFATPAPLAKAPEVNGIYTCNVLALEVTLLTVI